MNRRPRHGRESGQGGVTQGRREMGQVEHVEGRREEGRA